MRRSLIVLAVVTLVSAAGAAVISDSLAPVGRLAKPAPPPAKPVTETFFGKKVTDNYRYMEALDPATIAWMKGQGAYTRTVLDGLLPERRSKKRSRISPRASASFRATRLSAAA